MANTYTVTSPYAGSTLYTFEALANLDTSDTFDLSSAETILFQVATGTPAAAFFGATVALVGSLDGTNWTPLYQFQQPTTGVAVTTAVSAVAANATIWHVQPTRFARVQVTGGDSGGTTANIRVRLLTHSL
jgi:hypothetical protein